MRRLLALRRLITSSDKRGRGQSLIEVALALPIMLIMISGLVEFGFALNQYLNALDAAREAARFATDSDPLDRDFRDPNDLTGPLTSPRVTNPDCGTTLDFYMQAACIAQQTMDPVDFNPTSDDVVISVFRVLSGTVIGRWPNCEPDATDDCPVDPSAYPDTLGEWHRYGRGDGCGNGLDDDGDTIIDDGCGGAPVTGDSEACNSNTDPACNPSRITASLVQSRINADAPDSAVLVVEVFYDYPHVLSLPWITPFVPNPLPLHTYTVLPLPAAEPSITITGTVTKPAPGGGTVPVTGVTILFDNGMTAITDENGQYLRTGLPSGWRSWYADIAGTDCSAVTPGNYAEHLTVNNLYNRDFALSGCIDVAATQTQAAIQTSTMAAQQTATMMASETQAAQTQEAAATQTAEAGSTSSPSDTATPTPSNTPPAACSDTTVSADFSRVNVVGSSTAQADGSSVVDVLVEVRNECDTDVNMAGRVVQLSSDRGTDVISPASVAADAAGLATFQVRSSTMSAWDINHRDFAESVLTAVADGVTLVDTAGAAFMCVGGIEGSAVNFDEVAWTFQNDTGIDRRLVELTFSRSTPQSASARLIEVFFDTILIWNAGSDLNPDVIPSTGWLAPPSSRHIDSGATHDLVLVHDFTVTGGQSFTVSAVWDNTSGTSLCTSNDVTVIR